MSDRRLDDYLKALDKMTKSRRDRIGQLGELGVTGLGTAAGFWAAVVLGAKTITIFGFAVVVGTTPIGWLIGAAVLVGAVAYVLTKLVRSGGKYDTLKDLHIRALEQRINEMRDGAQRFIRREPKMTKIISSLQLLVANGHMTPDKSTRLLAAIEKKHLSVDEAFEQIHQLVQEKMSTEAAGNSGPST